jgi:hypothetical protein
MSFKRRIFVSVQKREGLDERRRTIRDDLVEKIKKLELQPEIFLELGTAAGMSWSFHNVFEIMRRCIGAVILATPK